MKTIKIYGASDDLVEIEGTDGNETFLRDEFSTCANNNPPSKILIEAEGHKIEVHCVYDGCWCFAIGSADDDSDYEKMPDWKITRTWGDEVKYSETVTIEIPEDEVDVSWEGNEEE